MAYINNIRMFVRVYELGNMSAAARDLRVSAAVASSRIGELERHLGIRLFARTTRSIQPTEQGRIFYQGAQKILDALEDAEAAVHEVTLNPRGSIFVSAPLGVGRYFIAPQLPVFKASYPDIHVRLRLSDRKLDLTGEGLDLSFHVGKLVDSDMRVRGIAECPRVLAAAPAYVARRGMPLTGKSLLEEAHDCLLLRFPGSPEFRWTLQTSEGQQSFDVDGPFASDDGQVLIDWALAGHGIILKPVFEIADHLARGDLVPVCIAEPPEPVSLACLFPHKRYQDPKIRLFIDFMSAQIKEDLREREGLYQLPRYVE
ncbi:LysR family transcriptional regulator [Brevirhabdus sp.]|uniref:LysR family transcriptional regulator n=1 Tax=Brevirhabdus sp. TaxID=2004514 RepID=UPI00405A36AA